MTEQVATRRVATPAQVERQNAVDAMVETGLADPFARDFVNGWMSACTWIDDLIDGDTEIDDTTAWKMFELLLYQLPANPFFLAHHSLLLPVMRTAMSDYQTATGIEREARWAKSCGKFEETDDCPLYRLLRSSFEQRNSFFDIVPHCVEILYGGDVRERFAREWFALTRDYERFDDYVAKVTARQRPLKPPYPEAEDVQEAEDA